MEVITLVFSSSILYFGEARKQDSKADYMILFMYFHGELWKKQTLLLFSIELQHQLRELLYAAFKFQKTVKIEGKL